MFALFIFFLHSEKNLFTKKIHIKETFHKKGQEKLRLENENFFIGLRLENYNFTKLTNEKLPKIYFYYEEFDYKTSEFTEIALPTTSCDKVNISSNISRGVFDLSTFEWPDLTSIRPKQLYGD